MLFVTNCSLIKITYFYNMFFFNIIFVIQASVYLEWFFFFFWLSGMMLVGIRAQDHRLGFGLV